MSNPLEAKLKEIFATSKKAAQIVIAHKGQSFESIKQAFDLNVSSHVIVMNHITVYVQKVLNRRGDLRQLSTSAAKRITLSDPKIELAAKTLSQNQIEVFNNQMTKVLSDELAGYFENYKGQNIDQNRTIEDLTEITLKKVNQILSERK